MAMTLADLLRSGKTPEELNALLSGSTIGSGSLDPNFMGGEPYMPPQEQPMNSIVNARTGRAIPLVDAYGRPSQSQGQPQALDYSSAPVDFGGMKGYRVKGDPMSIVMADGRIVRMGADTGADRKRMGEDLQMQMTRQKLSEGNVDEQLKRAQLAELMGMDPAQMGGAAPYGVNNSQYRKEMAKIAAKEMSAKIPGTEEYKRIQDEARKSKTTLNDATNTLKYSRDTADALERNIADLMGVKVEDLPKILDNESAAKSRVAPAVGSIDAMTPTFLQNTANIQSNIDALKSKAQMVGLTNLRKSGVAPGTVTEREWPKFEAMLGNIDPRLGEAEFVKQIRDIYKQINSTRDAGELDYQQLTSGLPQSMLDGSRNAPKAAEKQSGKTVTTPDGRNHTFPTEAAAAAFRKAAGI